MIFLLHVLQHITKYNQNMLIQEKFSFFLLKLNQLVALHKKL
ncbi:hypothetical protein B488_08620 [Liberibacter crescens BT-1]|uniref:Uncharacterized protein n=1 Tax=Liberibacter crescens (strain BT-1) TaxID=1215343 RepID=L0ETI4_LIBCB|nr:hypothetical protein B488_08620 [Liberibacter crescens BT-1]